MERQDVVLSRISYLCMVRKLREAGYAVVYSKETFLCPESWQDSTSGLKIPFSKGNFRIVELHDP